MRDGSTASGSGSGSGSETGKGAGGEVVGEGVRKRFEESRGRLVGLGFRFVGQETGGRE
jgi:hypothetical protein